MTPPYTRRRYLCVWNMMKVTSAPRWRCHTHTDTTHTHTHNSWPGIKHRFTIHPDPAPKNHQNTSPSLRKLNNRLKARLQQLIYSDTDFECLLLTTVVFMHLKIMIICYYGLCSLNQSAFIISLNIWFGCVLSQKKTKP